jgi:hypothetical protein
VNFGRVRTLAPALLRYKLCLRAVLQHLDFAAHELQNRHAVACGPLYRVKDRMLAHGGSVDSVQPSEVGDSIRCFWLRLCCFVGLLLCLAGLAPLHAQNYTLVAGIIQDGSGASAPEAMVSVINEDTGFRRVTQSRPDGGYVVSSLQPGVYKITVRKEGFRTAIRFGVRLNPSQSSRVDFRLVVGSVQETVTVEGATPLLNTEDASVGTLVGRDEIERLPLNGGGLLGLLQLAPGVVVTPATRGEAGQFTVAGQRPNTNSFIVDGVSANSGVSGGGLPAQSTGAALPGMTAFGSLDSLVSRDALQEARVQTSTTVPEFGRLPGAQISLSSRSGSNQLHGSLYSGFRNELLDANDWFANQHGDRRASLSMQDFAAALGGPLRHNRTFFFLSYEGMRLSQPFVWRQPVPSLAAREAAPAWVQPVLNLFPAPNGPGLGNGLAQWTAGVSRPSRLDTGGARLDHAISSRLTAFGRYSDSPSFTEFGSSPVNMLDLRSQGVTLGLNWRARPDLVFDLRFNASSAAASSHWEPAGSPALPVCFQLVGPSNGCDSLVRLSIAGVGQVVSGPEGRRSQSQYEVNQTAGWNRGTHSVQFGASYVRLAPVRRDAAGAVSVLASNVDDLADIKNVWFANSPSQSASAVMKEVSIFAADTWRITPRLTITYGLRWEISPAPQSSLLANFLDPLGNPTLPSPQPIWQSTYANLAPRLGLAYRPTNRGRTVIRAGAGFYFDSSLSLATDLVNGGPLNVTQYTSGRNGIFSTRLQFGFPQDLRLPLVKQWNFSLEHALDDRNVVSIGYVGSSGRNLIRREIGGLGSTATDWYAVATNHGSSDYHGLQAQYRRRLGRGIQTLASYAWSHSIDNSSTDTGLYWAGSGLTPAQDRASSDFDVRHSLTAGFTYEIPRGGWALDGMFHARTGFPVNVLNAEQFTGINFENIFRPDLTPGQPVWIADPSTSGGRRINAAAFQAAPGSVQGTLGRNALSGFGMAQFDLALRREFFARENRSLQLRIEAYNAFNHANFADPIRFLSSPLFGQSPSMLNLMLGTGSPGSGLAPLFQGGGPRSLQIALRFRF